MANNSSPILPGATIGVLGAGQLGRMFTMAARQMGYRVHTLSPETDTPTGQVADKEISADYDNLDAVADFARGVRVVTFEFENIPSAATETAARHALVRPADRVLHTTQQRLREKHFLREQGIPVTPFHAVRSAQDLQDAVTSLGLPLVLKTASFGYDGKGQTVINNLPQGLAYIAGSESIERIAEGFVDFEMELSVVAARGVDGQFAHWGAIENRHHNHILDLSISPASVPDTTAHEAAQIARAVLEALDVVGVLCVEFFLTTSGKLLVNELAPRPHNSGHLTIDACITSQFEQQVRAVCGLPLGSTRQTSPAAMANLLGDLWKNQPPHWESALALPEVKLHLYGKSDPRPGRKMGHLTALAETPSEAAGRALAARDALISPT